MLLGEMFSTPIQTGPGAHQPPIQWVLGLSQRVKQPGHGVDHTPPSSTEVIERVELYPYSTSGHSWPVLG